MTTQVLYSCRHGIGLDSDFWQITKFVDGEVESSYRTTPLECDCPAGVRPSCRHRQMLPMMIAQGIVNTHYFYDFSLGRAVDFEGTLKSNFDAMNELAAGGLEGRSVSGQLDPTSITTEQLDVAQFGKVLHQRPAWRRL